MCLVLRWALSFIFIHSDNQTCVKDRDKNSRPLMLEGESCQDPPYRQAEGPHRGVQRQWDAFINTNSLHQRALIQPWHAQDGMWLSWLSTPWHFLSSRKLSTAPRWALGLTLSGCTRRPRTHTCQSLTYRTSLFNVDKYNNIIKSCHGIH